MFAPPFVTMAARRSWVLRRVADGVAEEARTRGFASRAFTRFARIVAIMMRRLRPVSIRNIVKVVRLYSYWLSLRRVSNHRPTKIGNGSVEKRSFRNA